nr:trichohyalin-like [Nothobranchius furzeri]
MGAFLYNLRLQCGQFLHKTRQMEDLKAEHLNAVKDLLKVGNDEKHINNLKADLYHSLVSKDLVEQLTTSQQDLKSKFEDEIHVAKKNAEHSEKLLQEEIQAHQNTKTELEDLRSQVTHRLILPEKQVKETEKKLDNFRSETAHQFVLQENRSKQTEQKLRDFLQERNVLLEELVQRSETDILAARQQAAHLEAQLKKEIDAHQKTKCQIQEERTEMEKRFIVQQKTETELRKKLEVMTSLKDMKMKCKSMNLSSEKQAKCFEEQLQKEIDAHQRTKAELENLNSEMAHQLALRKKRFKQKEKKLREGFLLERNILLDELKQTHESEVLSAKEKAEHLENELQKEIDAHQKTKAELENLDSEMAHQLALQEKQFKQEEKKLCEDFLQERNVLLQELNQSETDILAARQQAAHLEEQLKKEIDAHQKTKCQIQEERTEMEKRFIVQQKTETELRKKLEVMTSHEDMKMKYKSMNLSSEKQAKDFIEQLQKEIHAHQKTKAELENLDSETTHQLAPRKKRFKQKEKKLREDFLQERNVLLEELVQRSETDILAARQQAAHLEAQLKKEIDAHQKTKCQIQEERTEMEKRFIVQQKTETELRNKLEVVMTSQGDMKMKCKSLKLSSEKRAKDFNEQLQKEIHAHQKTKAELENLNRETAHQFVLQENRHKQREKKLCEDFLQEKNVLLQELNQSELDILAARQQAAHLEEQLKKEIDAHQRTKCQIQEERTEMEKRFIVQQKTETELRNKLEVVMTSQEDMKMKCKSLKLSSEKQAKDFNEQLQKEIHAHQKTKAELENLNRETTHQFVLQENRHKQREEKLCEDFLQEKNVLLQELNQSELDILAARQQAAHLEEQLKKEIDAHQRTKCQIQEERTEMEKRFIVQQKTETELRNKLEVVMTSQEDMKMKCKSLKLSSEKQAKDFNEQLQKEIHAHQKTKAELENLNRETTHQFVLQENRHKQREEKLCEDFLQEKNVLLQELNQSETDILAARQQAAHLEEQLKKEIDAHQKTKAELENLNRETAHQFVFQENGFKEIDAHQGTKCQIQ